jgi:hypothetical protein
MSPQTPNSTDLPRIAPSCGDFDIRIDADGRWWHQGSPINREEIVRLFSSILSRDGDGGYWLTTPAECGRIQVDDVPFVAISMTVKGEGKNQTLEFETNVGDRVVADQDHPIRVAHLPAGGPTPYLTVRPQIEARIARSVYYDLVARGEEKSVDNEPVFGVWSHGIFFPLGRLEES